MALAIIYLAVICLLWFQIMLVNEMEKRTEKLKREVKSIRDSIVSIDDRIEEIEQDIIATAQVAMNAQSIAKTNSKRLDRSVVYEHR
jgi:hypothetical protein